MKVSGIPLNEGSTKPAKAASRFLHLSRLDLLVLAVVVGIGAINLPFPFHGDQACFVVGAREMKGGAVLYRDYWDIKQPGIFLFYYVGGSLFGFTEAGIHLFELIFMTLFAVALLAALRPRFSHPALASFVPLFTIGAYYGAAWDWHLTQVEAIVGIPLFFSMWFAGDPLRSRKRGTPAAFAIAGFAGGVVLLFKFIFLPILLAIWIAAFVFRMAERKEGLRALLTRCALPLIAAALIPLALTTWWFARHDLLPLLRKTFFEDPPRIFAFAPTGGSERLIHGILWFLKGFGPLCVLAVLGIGVTRGFCRDYFRLGLLLWAVIGSGIIFIQRVCRWEYHYLLLFVPVGVLATLAVDELWGRWKNLPSLNSLKRIAAATLGLLLVFSPILNRVAKKAVALARHGCALGSENAAAFRDELSGGYRTARQETSFLSNPGSLPGGIFVCGDPLFYFVSGRNQAIALSGWCLEFFLPEQWSELNAQLRSAQPPYVFVAEYYLEFLRKTSPATVALLDADYAALPRTREGEWFVRR